jgi:lactate dehydrogenase-like 2-hydroxyacid dehydrogenase
MRTCLQVCHVSVVLCYPSICLYDLSDQGCFAAEPVIWTCTLTRSISIALCLTYLPDLLKRVNVLVTLSWLPPKASDVPNIDFIQFISAGTNHVAKHPIYTDTKIPLCSANGVHGPQIAEWVVMMDLIHNHNYIDLYKKQQKREWKHNGELSSTDNVGKTVGILGYGSIGRQGESVFRLCASHFCLA